MKIIKKIKKIKKIQKEYMEGLDQNSYVNKNDISRLYLFIKNSKNKLNESLLYQ